MFDWLFEGRIAVYCLLGVLATMFFLMWWRSRKRNLLLAAGAVLALAGAYFVLGTLVETPRRQIERKLHEMADAVKARDTEGIFKHIAKDFKFRGLDRTQFHEFVGGVMQKGWIDSLELDDFTWPDGGDDRTRPMEFRATPRGPALDKTAAFPVRGKFVREADGQWRLLSFEVYNPVLTNEPMPIPGLP